jgi:hypothetical protein
MEDKSDWQKLIERCVTDADYQERLDGALDDTDDRRATAILEEIGVGATTERLAALRDARIPMRTVSSSFGDTRLVPIG